MTTESHISVATTPNRKPVPPVHRLHRFLQVSRSRPRLQLSTPHRHPTQATSSGQRTTMKTERLLILLTAVNAGLFSYQDGPASSQYGSHDRGADRDPGARPRDRG